MAKKKLEQPPHEVAQIVFYYANLQNAFMVRYTDMKKAHKEYEAFVKVRERGDKHLVLTGATSTVVVFEPANVAMVFLVAVESTNQLTADTQLRMNAMMTLPQT